jgi:hypothetical protein
MPYGGRRSNDRPAASRIGPAGVFELRARPQPVTRINRRVVIGGAEVLLVIIALVVLVALTPPGVRVAGPQELFNVEYKPITDALSKLAATYDGIKPENKGGAA